MKKLLHKLKINQLKNISEQSIWTLLCGLSCIAAVLISAMITFYDSAYFYYEMIKLAMRMVALSVLIAAIVDFLCAHVQEK